MHDKILLSHGEGGPAKGAARDDKKGGAKPRSRTFVADDPLRPAALTTYDMKGNLTRTTAILNVQAGAAASDIASHADNERTASTVVDAHVAQGWY